MDLIGKKVQHSKFGEGVIIQQDASYISVRFKMEANSDPKKFIYPSCFKTFLNLLDAEVTAQTEATLKQHEDQELKKNQQAMEESKARHCSTTIHIGQKNKKI